LTSGIGEDGVNQPRKRPLKVGIFLPLIERPGDAGVARWREIEQMATLAEDAGFDSLWIPDHLIFRHPGQPVAGVWEAMSMLAALAAVTKRVEIAPLVLCAGWRNPALLAKMADTIDEISGGRFILGLGAGWHQPEFEAFGYPFDHRVGRFEEAIAIIHGLLRTGHVDFEGTYYQARDCELRPRGPRPEGPPIMIGSTRPRMLRLAATYADQWNSDWRNRAASLPPLIELVEAACAEVGRDLATMALTAGVQIDLPGNTGRAVGIDGKPPLSGPPEQIAAELRAYAPLGISHIQLLPDPSTPKAVEALARVLELLDND
jgi:probable F420-dependent oxidoreductase